MRPISPLTLSLVSSITLSLAGCPGGEDPPIDRPPAPALYTEVDLADDELAMQALEILGARAAGGSGSCATCHGITRRAVQTWAEQAQVVRDTCLTDLEVRTDAAAAEMVACLRGPTADGTDGMYRAANASVFSAAAEQGWFRYVFEHGAGGGWQGEYDDFVRYAGMPNEDMPALTQAELDVVFTWFLRGAPEADALLPIDPPPSECVPFVSPEVAAHVERMATDGWAARNRADGILMYGCAGASRPEDCLADETAARDTEYGEGWDVIDGSTIRELFTTDYASSFWTRSSADGRFVAHGPGYVIDLQRDVAVPVEAPYDPGFFPDNSAFVWPGVVCEQSLLMGDPDRVTLEEAECDSASVGLYEHVGAGLAGSDYWVITGEYTSDNGGHSPTHSDTRASFSRGASQSFVRMTNSGAGFTPTTMGSYPTPFEGDGVLSPSSTLVLARIAGPDDDPLGYSMYAVEMGEGGPGEEIGTCRGTPMACAERPIEACDGGCSAGACGGTATACTTFTTASTCAGQSGCAWSGVSCSGSARACSALSSALCDGQDGCSAESTTCAGTPAPCAASSTEGTCEAAGCTWSTEPGPSTGEIELREVARYCLSGTKSAFSYDERYFITHHYNGEDDAEELGFTGPDDPGFAPYLSDGSSDLILVDLLTGARTRLTHMGPGQYALFPHFRSDGWIYFLVRGDTGVEGERVMATDAAFYLGN